MSGKPLELSVSFDKTPASAILYFRRVNQGERYKTAEMKKDGKNFKAAIPGQYCDTKYPIEYYFELRDNGDSAWLFPGFNGGLKNQSYFTVRQV
ncbi:MAG: hypothetical protein ABIN89_21035 [Chitinophagaceae bacterium]